LVVTALKGPAEVTVAGSGPVTVAERTVCTFSGKPLKAETKPLEPAAEQHLSAWTKQLPPGQGVGQLVIKDARGGTGRRLNIARYHAEVVLQPPVALVKLDQSFYNPSTIQEEGEFIFNLPPGASVSRFAMFVTKDQLIEGEVIERKRADEVYTTIVRGKRDPAILEQIGDNLFKMRVFPIFPKDIKRILLDFTLPLDGRGGQYQMQLPLLSNLLPIWDFKLFGAIRGPTPFASAQCPTIPGLKFVSQGPNEITFNFERPNYQPVSDLLIAFQQPTPQTARTFRQLRAMPLSLPALVTNNANEIAAALHPDGVIRAGLDSWNLQSGIYFQANLPVPANIGQSTPVDVLLLVDTSSNGTLDQVRPALQTTLASLRTDDRFRLVCVDAVSRPMHDGWLQTRSPEAVAAYQKFEQQICLGATDMLATCESVAPLLANRNPARRPVVIYIGDGLHSVNNGGLAAVAERCAEEITKTGAVLFTVNVLPPPAPNLRSAAQGGNGGFGGGFFQFGPVRMPGATNSPNNGPVGASDTSDGRLFLSRLTQGAGGRGYDFTDAQSDRARLIEWLLSGLPTPTRIENFKIAGCDSIDVYHPANLLPGEPFRIVGRKLGSVDKLEIAYRIKGADGALQPQSLVLTPATNDEDHLVGRFWAAQRLRHLQRLLAAPMKGGGNPDASKVIVALSREWSLLTPQTAFLVLETEADYQRWNVPRQGRRRYWSGKDVPAVEPLPADWLARIQFNNEASRRDPDLTGVADIDQQLEAASKAVDDQKYDLATQILDSLQKHKSAVASGKYRLLRGRMSNRRGLPLHNLGLKQGWFDPEQVRLPLPTGTDRLLTNFGTITTELLERHPFAEQLLQEITLPVGEMSLRDFTRFLKTTIGVNIFVDIAQLEEERVDVDQRFRLPRLKKLSVMNATHHVLDQWNLILVEESRRLKITTKTDGRAVRRQVLFPVQDLITKDPKFDLSDLQDPVFDREQQFLQRLETKLKKSTTMHLNAASLSDLVARLQRELDENIIIKEAKLEEESVAPDAQDINCEYDNVPLGDVLTWLLETKNLTYVLEHEALVLTTQTDGIAKRASLVYPAYGLIFRDAKPGRRQPRHQWFGGGMGMGGMGGGFGGGMGGGMGGMGGGGFGMGGGGGVFVDSNGGPSPLIDAFSNDSDESTPAQPGNAQPAQAEGESDSQTMPGRFDDQTGGNVADILYGVQQQTGGPPNSPWMDSDGEGGNAAFFYPSLCYVFRQTRAAHAEIAEYFRQQRSLQTRRGTNPSMVPIVPRDALSRNEMDVQALLYLVQNLTGGPPDSPWIEADGEGGTISYDRPRMALSIKQLPMTLDEISGVLVRLRRERYALMHQSRPWEQSISVGRHSGLFDGPWFARTADTSDLVGPANEPELTVLRVRGDLPAGRWTWADSEQTKSSDLTLTTAADRLQLAWAGWEVRLRGDQAAVYAPQLQYAELGTWGSAVRDWLDAELVFWPHRSNRDLATMFDVVVVPANKDDGPNHVRLQFTPAKLERQPVWIHIVYDKTTGLPVVWEAFRQSLLVQRFRFQPELTEGKLVRLSVRQESHDGKLLGTGTWTPSMEPVPPIADPATFPEGTLTIDHRGQDRAAPSPFEIGWQLLRKGDTALAEAEFRKILEQYPEHPLAQFLIAWSLNRQLTDVPQERLLAAYSAVIQNGPSELARSLIRL
ncbi:MAG: Vault protein inter-alpha-trypsin domain protein, partial [Planctomycetaceae bacterium]|nr:Vault protein inter-alpha-trypsin domain protein [Planctomycetaceae bacterium]